jgi:hypothetical protein
VLALAFVGYTIHKNVVGASGPYRFFPYIVLGWLLIAVIMLAAVPGLTARLRAGLSGPGAATTEPEAEPEKEPVS